MFDLLKTCDKCGNVHDLFVLSVAEKTFLHFFANASELLEHGSRVNSNVTSRFKYLATLDFIFN